MAAEWVEVIRCDEARHEPAALVQPAPQSFHTSHAPNPQSPQYIHTIIKLNHICLQIVTSSADFTVHCKSIQCESKKSPPWGYLNFSLFQKRLRIFNRFFTHLLYVAMYAKLQIFIQLSPTLTRLCQIKRGYLVHNNVCKCPPSAKTRAFRRLRSFVDRCLWQITIK